jgi:hypothetical protein
MSFDNVRGANGKGRMRNENRKVRQEQPGDLGGTGNKNEVLKDKYEYKLKYKRI